MKKLNYILWIFVFSLSMQAIWAQEEPVAQGGCNSVTVVSVPTYATNLYEFVPTMNQCTFYTAVPSGTMVHRMRLERLNHTTQMFETIGTYKYANTGNTFNNLTKGTYRVKVQVPRIRFQSNCEGGYAIVLNNANGQTIGYRGHYSEVTTGDSPGTFFSNEVVVGMTTPADIAFTFIDEPETGPETAYDYGEPVKINTSQCKNYNRWMIAIIEDGGQNRYMSTGWMSGKIGGNGQSFSLTELWQEWITWWQFEPLHSYHVQVVLENNECPNPSWNQLIRTFFVCPTGSGCRLGEPEEPQIRLGPNPAHSSFFLYNYDAGFYSGSLMIISDMAGQTKKAIPLTGNEIDVSALPAGVYAVQLVHEGKRVFSSKLVVSR
ncbi:MAG: T9SS type A sorting domain-containing protein [Saprospiraceae bacterium]|nr:T9SS type A sorting domain-containing protein [Saprospiraceae bacterium]